MNDAEPDALEVLPDGRKSRYRAPMTSFIPADNPDDIATVDEKVLAFRMDHPEGVIQTKVSSEDLGDGFTRYTTVASVWRKWVMNRPADSTGTATRITGIGNEIESVYPLETSETVAIGRALRFLGIGHTPKLEPEGE